LNKAKLANSK